MFNPELILARHEAIEERAGILEFDAGFTRSEAEHLAQQWHGFRVLVCGGRNFWDWAALSAGLDRLHAQIRFGVVIQGGARGADTLALRWTKARGLHPITEPADWDRYDRKQAGPIRNRKMVADHHPELCIAFPGGSGTADMIAVAQAANIPVHVMID
jgi:YspA, cpYpsA-related SLOG family